MIKGHIGSINSVAFSRDGMSIVSGSDDESVQIQGVLMGAETHIPTGHNDSPHSVAYSRYAVQTVSSLELIC